MDKTFVIQFTPDKKDYVQASRALAMKSIGFVIIAAVIIIIMVVSAVILIFPSLVDPSWRNTAVIAFLVGAFYILYYLVFIPFQFSNTYKSNEYLRKERQLVFTEEGVTLHIGDKTSELIWENFKSVITHGGFYLLVYTGEDRVYPFIPKRAFGDEATEATFVELIREKDIPFK